MGIRDVALSLRTADVRIYFDGENSSRIARP